jgi:hypothetical protein
MFFDFVKKYLFLLFFIFSVLIFIAHTAYTKTAIFADAKYYYSYTHSIVKDFDLDFTNEYANLNAGGPKNRIGLPTNFYPPGVSFFWIPGFFFADLTAQSVNLVIPNLISTSGYGFTYQLFVAATSIFLGIFGLYLVYKLLRDYFSDSVALITTAALFLTTNLFFYIAVEPINSHSVSFFVSAFFVYYFLRHKNDKHFYFTLGLISGVAGLVRTQDLLILILPAINIALEKINFPKLTTYFLQLTAGFAIGFLPQILLWKFFFNTFWYSPYINYGFTFLRPHIVHVLFNTQNGLFILTPTILFALGGLFLFRTKFYSLKFYSLTYFVLQLYLTSSWSAYTQWGSYSIRMLISTYPLLAFGLAGVVRRIFMKSHALAYLLLGFFTIYNFAAVIFYLLRF